MTPPPARAELAPGPAHVTPAQLEAFLSGKAGRDPAAWVEAHIDVCEDCRVLLSTLVRSQRNVSTHTTDLVKSPLPLREGDTIGQKYRVERILGSGGMGTVVAAWHQQLNQRVALKFMLPALSADPQAVARFQREARAAAHLTTEHAGRVLDLDALPDGTPFLVMEFLEGETVEARLERDRRIPTEAAIGWIRQALTALAEAHALGIVHRDFKPGNLFLAKKTDGGEVVKVLDFGIAKSAHPDIEHGLASTTSRMMVGSPPYMSPEQLNPGAEVDARADVWAVGAVLYQLLSGHLPFERETLIDLMYAIQTRPHRPLQSLCPEVPAGVCELVEVCLAKDPKERPLDAAAVLEYLDTVGSGRRRAPSRVLPRWMVPVWLGILAGLLAALAAVTFHPWRVDAATGPTPALLAPAPAAPPRDDLPLTPLVPARRPVAPSKPKRIARPARASIHLQDGDEDDVYGERR